MDETPSTLDMGFRGEGLPPLTRDAESRGGFRNRDACAWHTSVGLNMAHCRVAPNYHKSRHSGTRVSGCPESILTIVVMDSGFALRAPRNDGERLPHTRHAHRQQRQHQHRRHQLQRSHRLHPPLRDLFGERQARAEEPFLKNFGNFDPSQGVASAWKIEASTTKIARCEPLRRASKDERNDRSLRLILRGAQSAHLRMTGACCPRPKIVTP
jgi:hypothetical protein